MQMSLNRIFYMSGSIHPLAQTLNETLQTGDSPIFKFLSEKGRRAFFPSKGILGQSAAARGASINATIGTAFEEDGTPLCLECLEKLVSLPSTTFLYSPSYGNKDLRQMWREKMVDKNPSLRGKDFSQPVVTHALTHGLSVAGQLFLDDGDSVILPDLYWDNYELLFCESCGATLVTFPMFEEGRFNVTSLCSRLAEPGDKKVVLLNFPNNPTGYTATLEDADKIVDALLRTAKAGKRVTVLLDDAYFGLVYEEGVCTESLFARLANLHPNILAVKLDGSTKEDYVWGIRVGFITFASKGVTADQYRALESKAAGLVRGSISSCTTIGQQLLLHAYADPDYAVQKRQKYEILRSRYQKIKTIFENHPEYAESFEPMPFNSGYFMCVKIKGEIDPEEVRLCLIENYSTGVIVLSGLIRLAISSVKSEKLEQLFANIDSAVRDLKA